MRSAVCTSESSSAIEKFPGSMQTRPKRGPAAFMSRFGCGLGSGLGLESGVGLAVRPYLDPNRKQNSRTAYQPKNPFSQIVMGHPFFPRHMPLCRAFSPKLGGARQNSERLFLFHTKRLISYSSFLCCLRIKSPFVPSFIITPSVVRPCSLS